MQKKAAEYRAAAHPVGKCFVSKVEVENRVSVMSCIVVKQAKIGREVIFCYG